MRLPLAALALGALGLAAPAAHAQFGVAAGMNFDKLSDIEGSREATFNNASGYHIGVFVDLPLGPVALRPGIFYTDVGSLEAEDANGVRQNFDVNLIEAPIDVRFRIPAPVVKPYVSAGPVLRFVNQSSDEVSFEEFTVAGAAGAGIELSALGFRPFVEARYQFGLQKFADEFQIGGVAFTPESDVKLNTFMIRLGLTF